MCLIYLNILTQPPKVVKFIGVKYIIDKRVVYIVKYKGYGKK